MKSPGTEQELFEKLKEGDTKALEQVFLQLKNSVFNVALSYTLNKEDAEEITQDVFVEVFHSVRSFKGDSSLKTWVYRIAVNKSLDFLRFKNRKKRFAFIRSILNQQTGEVAVHPPDFFHPGAAMEQKENAAYLFAAIDKLPESQRSVFLLMKVEGLSQKETAEVMLMGEKAVESLYQRAKANLRKLLAGIYDELK